MKAFARVLTSPNSGLKLARLLLASNAIGDTGAVAIALALQRNTTASLVELDLCDNMLSDVGARALCLAIETVKNLQVCAFAVLDLIVLRQFCYSLLKLFFAIAKGIAA